MSDNYNPDDDDFKAELEKDGIDWKEVKAKAIKKYIEVFGDHAIENVNLNLPDYSTLDDELVNIIEAFEKALETGNEGAILRMFVVLIKDGDSGLLPQKGLLEEAKYYTFKALQIFADKGNVKLLLHVNSVLGNICIKLSQYEEAKTYFTACLNLATELDLKLQKAIAIGNLGGLSFAQGDFNITKNLIEEVSILLGDVELNFNFEPESYQQRYETLVTGKKFWGNFFTERDRSSLLFKIGEDLRKKNKPPVPFNAPKNPFESPLDRYSPPKIPSLKDLQETFSNPSGMRSLADIMKDTQSGTPLPSTDITGMMDFLKKSLGYETEQEKVAREFEADQGRQLVDKAAGIIGETNEQAKGFQDKEKTSQEIFQYEAYKKTIANLFGMQGTMYMTELRYDEAIDSFSKALETIEGLDAPNDVSSLLNNLGSVLARKGDFESAKNYAEQSLEIYELYKNPSIKAGALMVLSMSELSTDPDKANEHALEALKTFEKIGSQSGIIQVLTMLGDINFKLGKLEVSKNYFIRSLEASRSINLVILILDNLFYLFRVSLELEDLEQAKQYAVEAIELSRKTNNKSYLLNVIVAFGGILNTQYLFPESIQYLGEGLSLVDDTEDILVKGKLQNLLGVAYIGMGDASKAGNLFLESLEAMKQVGDEDGIQTAQRNLNFLLTFQNTSEDLTENDAINSFNFGQELFSSGNFAEAKHCFEKSLEIFVKFNNTVQMATLQSFLGMVTLTMGEVEESIVHFKKALKIKGDTVDVDTATILGSLGNAYMFLGDFGKARSFMEQRLNLEKHFKNDAGISETYVLLGTVTLYAGNAVEAESFCVMALEIAKKLAAPQLIVTSLINLGKCQVVGGKKDEGKKNLQEALSMAEGNGFLVMSIEGLMRELGWVRGYLF